MWQYHGGVFPFRYHPLFLRSSFIFHTPPNSKALGSVEIIDQGPVLNPEGYIRCGWEPLLFCL